MNKMMWIYAVLSACGGAGIMAAVSPSKADLDRAMLQVPSISAQDCRVSSADRAYLSQPVRNSRAGEY